MDIANPQISKPARRSSTPYSSPTTARKIIEAIGYSTIVRSPKGKNYMATSQKSKSPPKASNSSTSASVGIAAKAVVDPWIVVTETTFICAICGRSMKLKRNIKRHQVLAHGRRSRPAGKETTRAAKQGNGKEATRAAKQGRKDD